MTPTTTDPLVALCEEWFHLNAAYDEVANALCEADPEADLPIWPRLNELYDAIPITAPRTLDGLIAQQAVLRSIEPL